MYFADKVRETGCKVNSDIVLDRTIALVAAWLPPEAYDNFFPGAREFREMYQYYEQYTYFGPEVPGGFTGFADWAKVHMKPT